MEIYRKQKETQRDFLEQEYKKKKSYAMKLKKHRQNLEKIAKEKLGRLLQKKRQLMAEKEKLKE